MYLPFPSRSAFRSLLCGAVVVAAAMGAAPSFSQDAAGQARDVVARIAASEGGAGAGRITLGVREQRGVYRDRETLADVAKRLAAEKTMQAEGTLTYGPGGWLKDLVVLGPGGVKTSTHTRTAESEGTLRLLVETAVNGQPQKLGRVSKLATTSPADAVLSRRVAKSLEGIQWSFAGPEGDLLKLQGTRATEKHILTLRRTDAAPGYQVASWDLTRFLVGPNGETVEQSTTCRVTAGEKPGAISRIEEWVINRPPLGNVAYRITDIKKEDPLPGARPEDVLLKFPAGTVVTDARGEVPVEYEQTAEGVNEADVSRAANALAKGRAKEGDPAPPFEVRDLKGNPVRLSDYNGKILVLYWFSTASARAEEAAKLVRGLYDDYKGKGVQFLALGIADEGNVEQKADTLRKRAKWSFPVAIDATGEAMHRYGQEAGVPKVAVVDPRGTLVYARPGLNPDEVAGALDRLVKGARQ